MTLRPATQNDAPAIAQILGGWRAVTPYIPPPHTREEDRDFVAGLVTSQDVVVAVNRAQIQGVIARDETKIRQLYLSKNARSKGTGTALLNHIKAKTEQLKLWCFQANTGARRFYERHGFVAEQFTDGADNEEHLPDIRYVWSAKG
ncbi:MAG: GNAT family N-acetyltransferase [Pseudomonadota bacterium]